MGSPANRSGLQHGDVIIKLNGVTCDKPLAELKHLLDGSDTVMLTVKRGRAHDAVTFTPRRPPPTCECVASSLLSTLLHLHCNQLPHLLLAIRTALASNASRARARHGVGLAETRRERVKQGVSSAADRPD